MNTPKHATEVHKIVADKNKEQYYRELPDPGKQMDAIIEALKTAEKSGRYSVKVYGQRRLHPEVKTKLEELGYRVRGPIGDEIIEVTF